MIPLEIIEFYESRILAFQSELNTYQKRCEQYSQAYDSLQHQVQELLRYRFGKKSERFIDPENPQLSLFEDTHQAFAKHDTLETQPLPAEAGRLII
jgi:hypothetical protein